MALIFPQSATSQWIFEYACYINYSQNLGQALNFLKNIFLLAVGMTEE